MKQPKTPESDQTILTQSSPLNTSPKSLSTDDTNVENNSLKFNNHQKSSEQLSKLNEIISPNSSNSNIINSNIIKKSSSLVPLKSDNNNENNELNTNAKKNTTFALFLAALSESFTSTLGIFMTGAVLAEKLGGGSESLLGCLAVAVFFGTLICYYTYRLLKLKKQEEQGLGKPPSTGNRNNFLWLLSVAGLLLTTIAAGLDAGSALFQQGISHTSTFLLMAFMFLGVLSLFCRSAKFYICDLGVQAPKDKLLGLNRFYKNKDSAIGKGLRGAVFQLFPFGEAVAHLLAAYIIYSDLVSPYFLNGSISNITNFQGGTNIAFHLSASILLATGVTIGLFAFFAQYIIICATDLDWGASTLGDETSKEIDNRFGAIGRFLLWSFPAIIGTYRCKNAKKAHERLINVLWLFKILGQGVFVAAGCILLTSIIFALYNGLSPTQVSGSIHKIGSLPAIGFVSIIFVVGFLFGAAVLGYRDWKAKNANHEIDLFAAQLILNNEKYKNDNTLKKEIKGWRNKRDDNKKPKKLWIETQQEEKTNTKTSSKVIWYFLSFTLGAIIGACYGYEKLNLSIDKLVQNRSFYMYVAIGGVSLFLLAALILCDRKELLHKDNINDEKFDARNAESISSPTHSLINTQ